MNAYIKCALSIDTHKMRQNIFCWFAASKWRLFIDTWLKRMSSIKCKFASSKNFRSNCASLVLPRARLPLPFSVLFFLFTLACLLRKYCSYHSYIYNTYKCVCVYIIFHLFHESYLNRLLRTRQPIYLRTYVPFKWMAETQAHTTKETEVKWSELREYTDFIYINTYTLESPLMRMKKTMISSSVPELSVTHTLAWTSLWTGS